VGSEPLHRRVASLQPDVHVFGHTHFGWDAEVEGVRYLQAALATPKERTKRMRTLEIGQIRSGPLCLYDEGAFLPRQRAVWSEFYRHTERTPAVVDPAPWVADYYRSRSSRRSRAPPA
jgi:hypothetical protein